MYKCVYIHIVKLECVYIYIYGFGPVSGVIFYEVFYTW